ncbi:hypothetical protein TSOC_008634 [Tetrabaena socialis]|uniref:Uncharacterized protein n=1 Tax=Tetrabaena socialis TaxID=47790 RepID=A0A2J7ZXZ5_9CHLO|nr:hypothetical protein TSOC_008634 [Tetrabaena socialis]|eukprot:PNH05135.1 hypothetical protein TSOC_008634 [Tetrabaena socialis]
MGLESQMVAARWWPLESQMLGAPPPAAASSPSPPPRSMAVWMHATSSIMAQQQEAPGSHLALARSEGLLVSSTAEAPMRKSRLETRRWRSEPR